MYNIEFEVKYQDIEKDLLNKLKNKSETEYEENSDEEYEYSSQDILDICNKLYRDELLSVFYADNIYDEKLDKGMFYVFNILNQNLEFKLIIEEIEKICLNYFFSDKDQLSDEKKENLRQLLLFTLFSQNIFYITHKCICQQIKNEMIDKELLENLKKHSLEIIKNQFG